MNIATRLITWFRLVGSRSPRPRSAPARLVSTRRKSFATLGIGCLLFIALQLGLGVAAELLRYLKDPGYADKEIRLTRQEVANAGGRSVVMLGTSRTGFGFHAGRIRGQLLAECGNRLTVFNFGIPASGPVTHLIYTRRLLADDHRPNLLLVEVLPPGLADLPDGPLESRFMFGDRLRHDEAEVAIQYGFPPEKTREEWRGSVLHPWYTLRFPLLGRVSPSALPWHLRFDWSRSPDQYGWGTPLTDTVTPEQYHLALQRATAEYGAILADMRPTGSAARALGDLLTLCQEHSIPVKLVLMPESSEFRALYPPIVNERMYRFLNELCVDRGAELIDAREWLPNSAFTDGHHMLRPGAEAFSDRLNREVIRPFLIVQ